MQLDAGQCRTRQAALHAADWLATAHVANEGGSIAFRTVTAASAFQKTGGITHETSTSSRGAPAAQQAAEHGRSLALQLALLLALTAEATESHQVSCNTGEAAESHVVSCDSALTESHQTSCQSGLHVTQQRCGSLRHCTRTSQTR